GRPPTERGPPGHRENVAPTCHVGRLPGEAAAQALRRACACGPSPHSLATRLSDAVSERPAWGRRREVLQRPVVVAMRVVGTPSAGFGTRGIAWVVTLV